MAKRKKSKLKPLEGVLDLSELTAESVKSISICPPDPVQRQLRENIEILRALEKEWEDADKERRKRNKELESEGYDTLEQKIKALHDKLAKEQGHI